MAPELAANEAAVNTAAAAMARTQRGRKGLVMAATNDGPRSRADRPSRSTSPTRPVTRCQLRAAVAGQGVVARSLLPTAQISRKARRPTPPQPLDAGTFSLIALFKRLLGKITAGLGVVPINSALFTGSAAALNADILGDTDATLYRSVSIQLTGTWSATISPWVSVDGGTSWNNLVGINVQNNAQAINLTSNGIYAFSLPAGARFRLRAWSPAARLTDRRSSVPHQWRFRL